MDFETSVAELEADLRRLPGAKPLAQVERPMPKLIASDNDDEEMVSEDDEDDEEEEEEEVEEDELVEWIPPDCTARIIVTDVTVDNFTVTLRESERPEGFFGQSFQ